MKNVFEVIQEKIATINSDAVKTFNNASQGNLADEMFRLGFTHSPSVMKDYAKLDKIELLRARLIRYFNCKVLHEDELHKLEKQYKLMTTLVDRFVDVVPLENQKDIVRFHEHIKVNKLNNGAVETDLFHIPITDQMYITAPPSCFRAAANISEMTKAEYKKWLEEDPIVWKRIWRFNPNASFERRNAPTAWLGLVTAWGMEATLVNTN